MNSETKWCRAPRAEADDLICPVLLCLSRYTCSGSCVSVCANSAVRRCHRFTCAGVRGRRRRALLTSCFGPPGRRLSQAGPGSLRLLSPVGPKKPLNDLLFGIKLTSADTFGPGSHERSEDRESSWPVEVFPELNSASIGVVLDFGRWRRPWMFLPHPLSAPSNENKRELMCLQKEATRNESVAPALAYLPLGMLRFMNRSPQGLEGNPGVMSLTSSLCRRTFERKWNKLNINSKYLKNRNSARLSVGTLFKNSFMSANNELLMNM